MGVVILCARCGIDFLTLAPHGRYCSRSCQQAATRRSTAAPTRTGVCVDCGLDFQASQATQRYCSPRCRNNAHCRRNYAARRARGWRKVDGRVWVKEIAA